MVKLTITHANGSVHEYENVVAFDFYDKEFCESVAGRELTKEELADIEADMDHTEEVTCDSVTQTVKEVIGGNDD